MTRMTRETLADGVAQMEILLAFYCLGDGAESGGASHGVWTTSTQWFEDGTFMRFIRDEEGSRVEIGSKDRKRLMFLGYAEGEYVRYDEVPARTGKDGEARAMIREALLDAYGSVGEAKGSHNATHTDTEWKPRIRRKA